MDFKKAFHMFGAFFAPKNKFKKEEVNKTMGSEFLKSISFEENPFENEIPEKMQMFDLDGNEVDV